MWIYLQFILNKVNDTLYSSVCVNAGYELLGGSSVPPKAPDYPAPPLTSGVWGRTDSVMTLQASGRWDKARTAIFHWYNFSFWFIIRCLVFCLFFLFQNVPEPMSMKESLWIVFSPSHHSQNLKRRRPDGGNQRVSFLVRVTKFQPPHATDLSAETRSMMKVRKLHFQYESGHMNDAELLSLQLHLLRSS